jgi:hypothetical protein
MILHISIVHPNPLLLVATMPKHDIIHDTVDDYATDIDDDYGIDIGIDTIQANVNKTQSSCLVPVVPTVLPSINGNRCQRKLKVFGKLYLIVTII